MEITGSQQKREFPRMIPEQWRGNTYFDIDKLLNNVRWLFLETQTEIH